MSRVCSISAEVTMFCYGYIQGGKTRVLALFKWQIVARKNVCCYLTSVVLCRGEPVVFNWATNIPTHLVLPSSLYPWARQEQEKLPCVLMQWAPHFPFEPSAQVHKVESLIWHSLKSAKKDNHYFVFLIQMALLKKKFQICRTSLTSAFGAVVTRFYETSFASTGVSGSSSVDTNLLAASIISCTFVNIYRGRKNVV